jgi:hypothetical protein
VLRDRMHACAFALLLLVVSAQLGDRDELEGRTTRNKLGDTDGIFWWLLVVGDSTVDTAFDRRVPAKPFVPRSFRPLPLVHPFYRFSIGVRHFLRQLVAAPLLIGSSFLSITLSLVYAHWKGYAHCTLHITCLPQ